MKRSPPHLARAFGIQTPVHKYRARGSQPESTLQRQIVKGLAFGGWGFFFRIRNGATFSEARGKFLSNTAEPGIPDIHGWNRQKLATYIEVKFIEKIENKKKLIFKFKISDDQKKFLRRAHEAGCPAGVAFTLEDAIAIAANDAHLYPRHPRTFGFLSGEELIPLAAHYEERKRALAAERKDPLHRDVYHARTGRT